MAVPANFAVPDDVGSAPDRSKVGNILSAVHGSKAVELVQVFF